MFRFGISSASPLSTGSRAFARPETRRTRLAHWLAAAPLIAVAAFTFNGPAPAETASEVATDPAAAPQPGGRWSILDARKLIDLIGEAREEGLNPADYRIDALRMAVDADRTGAALDSLATDAALSLANDYANGRVRDKVALDWHMGPQADPTMLAAQLQEALDKGRLSKWLRGLLPDNEQYRALKAAYASAGAADMATREQLRANLERWRWMPRKLGDRYIYVNVPSYRLELMNGGVAEASYNVVVGAPRTPTPQLALYAQSVVANPSWTLPPSVLKEGGWRNKGYSVSRRADGSMMVRQAPGPRNALGRIKIDMPNAHAIYLHDTPQKAAFDKTNRALSHGCVRVQNIQELAALLSGDAALEDALADPARTRVLQLEQSVPVYIVYFTAQAEADGTIRYLGDPYARDRTVLASLGTPVGNSVRMAAR